MKQALVYLQVLQSIFVVVNRINTRANAVMNVVHVAWEFYLAMPTQDLALDVIHLVTVQTRNYRQVTYGISVQEMNLNVVEKHSVEFARDLEEALLTCVTLFESDQATSGLRQVKRKIKMSFVLNEQCQWTFKHASQQSKSDLLQILEFSINPKVIK